MKRNVRVRDDNGDIIIIENEEVMSLFNHYVDLDKIQTIEKLFDNDFEDYYDWRKSLGFNFVTSLEQDSDRKVDLHDFCAEFPKCLIDSEDSKKALEEDDWGKIFSLPHMNPDKPKSDEVKIMRNRLFDEFDKFFIPIKDIDKLNEIKTKNVLLIDYTREWNRCLFTKSIFVEDVRFYEFIYSDRHSNFFEVID